MRFMLFFLIQAAVFMLPIKSDALQKRNRPEDFVMVNRLLPGALFEIRYFTGNNFIGRPIEGYIEPLCFLSQKAAEALKRVYQDIRNQGYNLKIFDCYRPQRSVNHFVRWAKDKGDQKMKSQYYPGEDKSQLIKKGYIAEKSGHSRGSTIDLTLAAPIKEEIENPSFLEWLRSFFTMDDFMYDAKELDMGSPYDYFDALSHTADPRITKTQKENRQLLKKVMEKQGFINYEKEWWHFTLKDEPYPNTYFDFLIAY